MVSTNTVRPCGPRGVGTDEHARQDRDVDSTGGRSSIELRTQVHPLAPSAGDPVLGVVGRGMVFGTDLQQTRALTKRRGAVGFYRHPSILAVRKGRLESADWFQGFY